MPVGSACVLFRRDGIQIGVNQDRFLKDLNARGVYRIEPDLVRITQVLSALGNPQEQYPAIHIAGTNGKGSVAAALESVLRQNGYRTGLYTSPHLLTLQERVKIAGQAAIKQFLTAADDVRRAEKSSGVSLTHFEYLTAIAFQAFARAKVDIAIVECGMGGLWDATNVLPRPLASIITSIGLDHREWLGGSLKAIAAQKAGIIKPRGYVISGVQGPAAAVIADRARDVDATLVQAGIHFSASGLTSSWRAGKQTLRFMFGSESAEIVPFGLLGAHQVQNAGLVMTVIRHLKQLGWKISKPGQDIGLRDVAWPGRLQLLRIPGFPVVLLDGAHNPPAMNRLVTEIQGFAFRNKPKTFVFSSFKDKDFRAMASMIMPLANRVCLTTLPRPRGAALSALRQSFRPAAKKVSCHPSLLRALEDASRTTPLDGLIVVTGSLSLVGQALGLLASQTQKRDKERVLLHV